MMPFAPRAAVWRFHTRQHPHHGRLAGAVGTDERQAIPALDVEVRAAEHFRGAVRLARVVKLDHRSATLGARGKAEMNALSLGRRLDRHDLLEHLDPALHLGGLGGLVTEPIDEHLHARDLFLLFALGFAQLLHARVALRDVVRVGARIVGQHPEIQIRNPRDDRIEKEAVVRNQNHGMWIVGEILFEPVARLEVQMVRRLIEQQQRGPSEQQLGQRKTHLPSARQ